MSDCRDLKALHRAGKLARRQQRQLARLQLVGITAVTLHAHDQHLTIVLERLTSAALADERLAGRLLPPGPPSLP